MEIEPRRCGELTFYSIVRNLQRFSTFLGGGFRCLPISGPQSSLENKSFGYLWSTPVVFYAFPGECSSLRLSRRATFL
jgi:hypothetical protein